MALKYGRIGGDYGDEKVTGTTQLHPLGTSMELPDGRVYYYVQADGAITAGKICQSPVEVANHGHDLAVNTASAGDKSLAITLGATAATEDQYKDGYVFTNDETAEGHVYKIRTHLAVGSGAEGTFHLHDGDSIAVAFVAGTEVGLVKNPYKDFIVYPTTGTGHCVGVTATDIADDEYGWLQTSGVAAVLIDGTVALGNHVRSSDGTAGAVELLDRDAGSEVEESIGVATHVVCATTEYGMVDLRIRS